jgi:hypothetical protein
MTQHGSVAVGLDLGPSPTFTPYSPFIGERNTQKFAYGGCTTLLCLLSLHLSHREPALSLEQPGGVETSNHAPTRWALIHIRDVGSQ